MCLGADVNSLILRLRVPSRAEEQPEIWLGIYLMSDEPNCNKNSSMDIYLNFDVFALYMNIYLHTLHAHLHTTPADTVYTPHTDEWLVARNEFP